MPAIIDPVPPPDNETEAGPLWRRLLWFAGIAVASSLGVGLVAYGLRLLPFR